MSRTPMPDKNSQQSIQYIAHYQGEALGPFDVKFIEAMVMSGVYPSSLVVENSNTKERVTFASLVPAAQKNSQQMSSSPQIASGVRSAKPKSDKRKSSRTKAETTLIVVSSIIGVLFMVWMISLFKSDSTSSTVANNSTSEETSYRASNKASSNNTESTSQRSSNSSSWYSSNPSSKKTASNYTKARTSPAIDNTVLYKDAYGRTYRVSDSDYNRLQIMSSSLTLKGVRVDREKNRLTSLSNQIDNDRVVLNRSSQYQVDSFNRKVNRLNSQNSEVQTLVDSYNRDVNTFNAELERVGTPIH